MLYVNNVKYISLTHEALAKLPTKNLEHLQNSWMDYNSSTFWRFLYLVMFLFSEEARPDSLGSAWLQNLTSDSLKRIAIQMDFLSFTFTSYFHFEKISATIHFPLTLFIEPTTFGV